MTINRIVNTAKYIANFINFFISEKIMVRTKIISVIFNQRGELVKNVIIC